MCNVGTRTDLYRRIFDTASHSNVFCWATRSLQILQEWGMADFCEGDMSLGVHHYKRYVIQALEAKCLAELQTSILASSCFLSWRIIYPEKTLLPLLAALFKQPMTWTLLIASRALCRLRLNLCLLGHNQGSFSRARTVRCIACNKIDCSWAISPCRPFMRAFC